MNFMLTDDEKERIRAEEEFRAQLAHSTEKKASRAWRFANRPFGLWLLGSVSLGAITFTYQQLGLSYKAGVEQKEMQRKAREELRTRFSVAGYYLLLNKNEPCLKNPDEPPTNELVSLVLREADGEDSGPYEEFHGRSATALFSQLQEDEQRVATARTNWIYLEPKLRRRATQPQLAVPLKCDEVSKRLELISGNLR
jgi:hypothetical protein